MTTPRPGYDTLEIRPAQPALLREMNEQVVYDMIRRLRPISRAEIARRTRLSKPTVSLALRTLVDGRLVREVGMESGKPGRAGLLFEPSPEVCLAGAVVVSESGIRCDIVDLDGTVLASADSDAAATTAAEALELIPNVLDRAIDTSGRPRGDIATIAVAVPAIIDPMTGLTSWLDAPSDGGAVDFAAVLTTMTGFAVTASNSIHLAAVGEVAVGVGRDHRHVVVVAHGSHRGLGAVVDGHLHTGAHGAAGLRGLPVSDDLTSLIATATIFDPEIVVLTDLSVGAEASGLTSELIGRLADALEGDTLIVASELGGEAVMSGAIAVAVRGALETAFSSRLKRVADHELT